VRLGRKAETVVIVDPYRLAEALPAVGSERLQHRALCRIERISQPPSKKATAAYTPISHCSIKCSPSDAAFL
jgi:hypothetical protein